MSDFTTPWTVCSLTSSSAHGILPARILEQVAQPCSRGYPPDSGIEPESLLSPALAGGFFTTSTTWKVPLFHYYNIHYFTNKCLSSQFYGFSSSRLWMWELDYKESWASKNDAFELWCWRRLLRVPWTARRSNQSLLKEVSLEYSLEELMLELKLQYFGHLLPRTYSFEKTWCWKGLKAGRVGDDRGWDG